MSNLDEKEAQAKRRIRRLRGRTSNRQAGEKVVVDDGPPSRPRVDLAKNAPLCPGEDRAAYVALHYEMMKAYQPSLPSHFEVVARATGLIWRIRRIPALEAAAFDTTARSLGYSGAPLSLEGPEVGQSAKFEDVWDALFKSGLLTKIAEYEATLREQLKFATAELQEIMDWSFNNDVFRDNLQYTLSRAPDDPMWIYAAPGQPVVSVR